MEAAGDGPDAYHTPGSAEADDEFEWVSPDEQVRVHYSRSWDELLLLASEYDLCLTGVNFTPQLRTQYDITCEVGVAQQAIHWAILPESSMLLWNTVHGIRGCFSVCRVKFTAAGSSGDGGGATGLLHPQAETVYATLVEAGKRSHTHAGVLISKICSSTGLEQHILLVKTIACV